MEIISGFKESEKCYMDNNYIYIKSSAKNRKLYLKCKKPTCKATGVVAQENFTMINQHSHTPDLVDVEVLRFRNELRQRAVNEHTGLHAIFLAVQARYPNAAALISGYSSVQGMMRRARQSMMPPNPANFQEFQAILERQEYTYLRSEIGCQNRDFCNGVFEAEDGSKFVYFSSPTVVQKIKELGRCRLNIDGTFKVVPRFENLKQLLTIHFLFRGRKVSNL